MIYLIGGSVLPISNFILQEKFVKDKKPEYEEYDNGFYLATTETEEFIKTHTDNKELLSTYLINKEHSILSKEINQNLFDINIDKELFLQSKKYRSSIKNIIFDKKIEMLLGEKYYEKNR